MKTAIFIPVRLGSERLKRKALLEVKGKPIIEHLIRRIKTSVVNQIVLCTTTNQEDKELVELAKKLGIDYFQGSVDDILKRYLDAAEKFNVDLIINVDGDDILCDPYYIDKTVKYFHENPNVDYSLFKNVPLGMSPKGCKVSTLKKICELKKTNITDTGWSYYFSKSKLFKSVQLECDEEHNAPEIRMTLDYQEDFEFFKIIIEALYSDERVFSVDELMLFLKKNPEVIKINQSLDEKYKKRIDNYTKTILQDIDSINEN